MEPTRLDVRLPSDDPATPAAERVLRVQRFGPALDDDLTRRASVPVLCVHGLSANSRGYDPLGRVLAAAGRTAFALDLRGRGFSMCSGPGTYGWPSHALDLLAVADRLDAPQFDLVGHSMGAFVSMQLASLEASRIRRLVLIDGLGVPEAAAMPKIFASVQRLSSTYDTVEEYLARVRSLGTVEPWSDDWERYFRYDIVSTPGGHVRPRTSAAAVMEDAMYGSSHDPRALWPGLTMPTLIVRATHPLGDPGGFIVSASDRDTLLARAPAARGVEVDANHYGVLMHPDTLTAIREFLA
ncbi:MAG: alpha/beta hydrolase [Polyangiales bacterium]